MAKSKQSNTSVTEGLAGQRAYIKKREDNGSDFSLMVADAFVRGIRDLGYSTTATALDELVDNSLQANAQSVHVAFGYGNSGSDKPTAIAVIDDGHGMDDDMIRAAVMWGGTHREGDRSGFGRYGYGLPSASVSIGMRFTVYSWTSKETIRSVSIDIDEISEGKYRDDNGKVIVPAAGTAVLPMWVSKYCEAHFEGGVPNSGTVVLIDKTDRLKWKTTKVLQERLSDHLGLTYRNFLRQVHIVVNGRPVEAVDPLFLTPGARFYNGDAEGLPELQFTVKDLASGAPVGNVRVRYSYLPPRYFSTTYATEEMKGVVKARQTIMKDTLGIIVLRHGRQIDVVRPPREWQLSVQNNDRFFQIEIDFDPKLDEMFSVTTSKQQIGLSDRIWSLLREHGVLASMRQLRVRVSKELKVLKHERDEGKREGPRASEQAMQETGKFRMRKQAGDPIKRKEKAAEALKEFARRKAVVSGVASDVIERELEAEESERPYKVERESLPGAPFFRVLQRGGQVVLLINDEHRFYVDVYASLEATPRIRAGIEVLLFSIGVSELDSADDRQQFYEGERNEWSRILNTSLDKLRDIDADDLDHDHEEESATAA